MKPRKPFDLGSALTLLAALLFLAYGPTRSESAPLLAGFAIAFAAYLWAVARVQFTWKALLVLAIGLRIALLFAPISWTDDHFRYIWDGLCSVHGISPFAFTPAELIGSRPELFPPGLFEQLNSPDYYTVYPPLAQGVFALAAWIGRGDVWTSTIALRLIVIMCEIATLFALRELTSQAPRLIALYALNPLVIMELSVNVHTEALMVAPMLWSIVLFQCGRFDASAIVLALALAARLWPLMFLAWIPIGRGARKGTRYVAISLAVFFIVWIPVMSTDLIPHFISSIRLFVEQLEFNGGLFEALRGTLGDGRVKGTGLLSAITLITLGAYLFRQWRTRATGLAEAMLWILAIYFFGSQALHPWYIVPLIALSTLTNFRWPLLWSLLIVPTYLTYGSEPFTQSYWWIAVEYTLLAAFVGWEIATSNKGVTVTSIHANA